MRLMLRGEDGTALVQVSRTNSSVCWLVWTDGLDRPVDGAIVATASRQRFPLPVRLGRDGYASGCSHLSSRAVAKSVRRHPERYRLELQPLDGAPLLSGALAKQLKAGRPPGSGSSAPARSSP